MKYKLKHSGLHQIETSVAKVKDEQNEKLVTTKKEIKETKELCSASPYGHSLNSLRLSPMWNQTVRKEKEEEGEKKKRVRIRQRGYFSP